LNNAKYACPCCGYLTLGEKPPGTYDICPVCFWEDDGVQFYDENYEGGANRVCLKVAKKNFLNFGAIDVIFINRVRSPNEDEIPK
jgi:hypothetical protein